MPIFVAGTGRCGTTWLNKVLGEHPEILSLDHETWFMVGPGGLRDIAGTFTTDYHPVHSAEALAGFEQLLLHHLAGGSRNSQWVWWNLPHELGQERYRSWANQFLAALTWYRFDQEAVIPDAGEAVRIQLRVGRYFRRRADFVSLCRQYTDLLFEGIAQERGKRLWCEKSGPNLVSMDFLWELYPSAKIVHILRHPLEVVASHLDVEWAPYDLESVCSWLEPLYRRWLDYRDGANLDDRYIEVRLEKLAEDWPAERKRLFNRIGLDDVVTDSVPHPEFVTHQGRRLTTSERDLAIDRLGFAIEHLGYQ